MNDKVLQTEGEAMKVNDTTRTFPRTLLEAFPMHEPYAIEHYKRKLPTWPWAVVAALAWGYLCYRLL